MKCLLVVALAFIAFVAADDDWQPISEKEDALKIHEDCLTESGATKEQVDKIRDLEYPVEKEIQAYIHCGVKKFGIFTDENGYNLDRLVTQFDSVSAYVKREDFAACIDSNEQNSAPAERAYRSVQCLIRRDKDKALKNLSKKTTE